MGDKARPTHKRLVLTDISSRAWGHPADRGTLVALRRLPGFDVFVRRISGFLTAGASNMALHREVFDAIGGFDEAAFTAEDDDFCLRAQLAGYQLTYVPQMVLYVRQRSGLPATFHQARTYGTGARWLRAQPPA